jgi:hypothetical protein
MGPYLTEQISKRFRREVTNKRALVGEEWAVKSDDIGHVGSKLVLQVLEEVANSTAKKVAKSRNWSEMHV